jgi:hypothetical protein
MDVVADVNAVVTTGASSARQSVSVTQHRGKPVRDLSTRTEEEK